MTAVTLQVGIPLYAYLPSHNKLSPLLLTFPLRLNGSIVEHGYRQLKRRGCIQLVLHHSCNVAIPLQESKA